MPEGPSIVLFAETLRPLIGKKVGLATGAIKSVDPGRLSGHQLKDIRTWGKYLYLIFDRGLSLRMHFGMFGVFYADLEREGKVPKLVLEFSGGPVLRFYAVSLKYNMPLPGEDPDFLPAADIMSPDWDSALALKKLKALPAGAQVCDALLDQRIFAGLGNIIKNETLFRTRIQPESLVGALPPKVLKELVREAHAYSQDFLQWKREGVLRKNWQAHNKKVCPRCALPFTKVHTGVLDRRSFYCENCMVRYN